MKKLIIFLCAFFCAFDIAYAGSTINPTQPANGVPYTASVIRNNFAASYHDVTAILNRYGSPTAPASPVQFQDWVDVGVNPYQWKIYDGSQWLEFATINPATHTISVVSTPISPTVKLTNGDYSTTLSTAATSNLSFVFPADNGGIGYTLKTDSNGNTSWQQQVITPYDYGAVGDGVTDDTVALQNFFNALSNTKIPTATFVGNFAISSGLTIDSPQTLHLQMDATITATASMDTMLTITNAQYMVFTGRLKLQGTGSTTYATRTVNRGLYAANVGRMSGLTIQVTNMKTWCVQISDDTGSPGNSNMVDIYKLRLSGCGTANIGSAAASVTSTFSGMSRTGSSGSIAQRSVLSGVTVPANITDNQTLININNLPYLIIAHDAGAGTITVFPWLPATTTSGTIYFYIGGGLSTVTGGSGNVQPMKIGILDVATSAVAYYPTSPDAGSIDSLLTQAVGIGTILNEGLSSLAGTTFIGHLHSEGTDFNIVEPYMGTVSTEHSMTIGQSYGGNDYSKIQRLLALDSSGVAVGQTADVILLNDNSVKWKTKTQSLNLSGSTFAPTLSPSPVNMMTLYRNSETVTLTPDLDMARVFGFTDMYINFVGTSGGNNNPTGAITLNAASVNFAGSPVTGTVNGQSSLTFETNSGPFILHCYWKMPTAAAPTTNDWIVTMIPLGGNRVVSAINITPVGNVGGGTDDLMTSTVAANYLNTTNRGVHVTQQGTFANNANSKTLTTNFGGTVLLSISLPISIANGTWKIEYDVYRTGTNTQHYTGVVMYESTPGVWVSQLFSGNSTETETSNITIKTTATATTTDDVVQEFQRLELTN